MSNEMVMNHELSLRLQKTHIFCFFFLKPSKDMYMLMYMQICYANKQRTAQACSIYSWFVSIYIMCNLKLQ